ncbi:MAG: hypothetical protein OEW59_05335, partial [Gammaproteobacteria bacterium]|nr:hypothetical protein [Gammaproteobacteria bacterium]
MIDKRTPAALVLTASLSCAAAAETDWPHAGDIPAIEPVTTGLAGEKPADIVRYLMARGAMQVGISP